MTTVKRSDWRVACPVETRLRAFCNAWANDDCGAESVALAVLFPIVLVLILSLIQGGLWWHAHAVAAHAAQAGVDAGRPVGATTFAAVDAAQSFTICAGHGVLTTPQVDVTLTADTVRVAVSGNVIRVLPIPGLDIRIEADAQAVKERFTTPESTAIQAHPQTGARGGGR